MFNVAWKYIYHAENCRSRQKDNAKDRFTKNRCQQLRRLTWDRLRAVGKTVPEHKKRRDQADQGKRRRVAPEDETALPYQTTMRSSLPAASFPLPPPLHLQGIWDTGMGPEFPTPPPSTVGVDVSANQTALQAPIFTSYQSQITGQRQSDLFNAVMPSINSYPGSISQLIYPDGDVAGLQTSGGQASLRFQ